MTAATLIDPETSTSLELMRWTRGQFETAAEKGAFDENPRVELLDGYILAMPVQSPRHVIAVDQTRDTLAAIFHDQFCVRAQSPFALDDFSAPEPDVAVVPGQRRDYATEHPTRAVLLVEVSDATLAKDRGRKLRAYARNGVPEYWIVNLQETQLEVYRDPQGETYGSSLVFRTGQTVATLAKPDAPIAVADLLS